MPQPVTAELTVFSAQANDDRAIYVGGVADAVAYQPRGAIDLVVDWKTDVTPSAQQIDLYREQMRDYLVATGAREGLLVFVTTDQLVRVRTQMPRVDFREVSRKTTRHRYATEMAISSWPMTPFPTTAHR